MHQPEQSHLKLLWRIFFSGPTVMASVAAVLLMDQPDQPLKLKRLVWGWPLAVAASVAAVLLIRGIAVALLKPDADFQPLSVATPVIDTAVAVTLAAFVFLAAARYSLEAVRDYRALAARILVISFVPDIALAVLHWFGGGWPEAIALAAMHVAVWAVCVLLFPLVTKDR